MKKDTLNQTQTQLLPWKIIFAVLFAVVITSSCADHLPPPEVQQWTTHEITLKSQSSYDNGYTDMDVWAYFTNGNGDTLTRPAFWDGGNTWKIRFSPPDAGTTWYWTTFSSPHDRGLSGKKGSLISVTYTGNNSLLRRGLLKMSEGKRNIIHANGKSFLVVGDTPWSIPFRATTGQVKEYAADRMSPGLIFNGHRQVTMVYIYIIRLKGCTTTNL
ncbi:MAG: DUF5060 domain-containing protein [Bacteroidales bacterium]|nr:DUF5060 domain-containing protein [Bacteroidales bacterium]